MTTATREHADPHGLIPDTIPARASHRPAKVTHCRDSGDARWRAALAAEGRASRWDSTPIAPQVHRGGCGKAKCEAAHGGSCVCLPSPKALAAWRARVAKAGQR